MRKPMLVLFCAAALCGCASSPRPRAVAAPSVGPLATSSAARRGVANLTSASGSLVSGRLTLLPMGSGVRVSGQVGGLAPYSVHGLHIHETGNCSAADASSAGGHFNPTASTHGRAQAPVHHAGDVANITADASGVAQVNADMAGVVLGGGAANDIAGRALVVHAAPDDYRSQPSGNSGGLVACGAITAQP